MQMCLIKRNIRSDNTRMPFHWLFESARAYRSSQSSASVHLNDEHYGAIHDFERCSVAASSIACQARPSPPVYDALRRVESSIEPHPQQHQLPRRQLRGRICDLQYIQLCLRQWRV
jgi:hypothetical protein